MIARDHDSNNSKMLLGIDLTSASQTGALHLIAHNNTHVTRS